MTMSRMANPRPISTTRHTLTRRGLLTGGLAAGFALAAPGLARAVPIDPEDAEIPLSGFRSLDEFDVDLVRLRFGDRTAETRVTLLR